MRDCTDTPASKHMLLHTQLNTALAIETKGEQLTRERQALDINSYTPKRIKHIHKTNVPKLY